MIKSVFPLRCGYWLQLAFSALVMLGCVQETHALTGTEADSAFDAYNKAFLVQKGDKTYYRQKLDAPGKTYFWMAASEIQLAEDVYIRTRSPDQKKLVKDLLNTFLAQNGKDWKWNEFNDDLGWADMAFVRGYEITGDTAFLNASIAAWNLAYDRGWDDKFGGGIWWDTKHKEKGALSNNPIWTSPRMVGAAEGRIKCLPKGANHHGKKEIHAGVQALSRSAG